MKYALGERRIETHGDHWIAPDAVVMGSVVLERNASIWWQCVVRGDSDVITIGENANVQDACVLHTDPGIRLTIGRNVSIGHLVMLHGCTIGDNSLIGIRSTILNRAVIGKNCLIGAGALITEGKEIPDGSVVMGAPGRIVRQVTADEIAHFREIADHYVENFKRYQQELRAQG
jgi:carbonic anhydrase/acetyltransferase-like protein (isoleucine patch superfamily)